MTRSEGYLVTYLACRSSAWMEEEERGLGSQDARLAHTLYVRRTYVTYVS
jgi:hypothetical protein